MGALPPGAAVKILYHQDDLRSDLALHALDQRNNTSVLMRASSSRIPSMVISDRRSAIVFIAPQPKSGTAVKTEQPETISILSTLFDQAWKTPRTFARFDRS